MRAIQIHLILGSTPGTRKKKMRDNMLRNAERLSSRGLDTRIPFLKAHLLGEKSAPPAAGRRGPLPPAFCEGEIISAKDGIRSEDVVRFNIANSINPGLVASPLDYSHGCCRFKIVRCSSSLVGDLRISFDMDIRGALQADAPAGFYAAHMHHIFLKSRREWSKSITVLTHEMEHAVHDSIGLLCGFPEPYVPVWAAEYLAMLAPLDQLYNVELPNILLKRDWDLNLGIPDLRFVVPHLLASGYFLARLLLKHGMRYPEICDAIDASNACDGTMASIEAHPGFPELRRMWEAGKIEYVGMYHSMFGVRLADIKEVVASLPTI